MKKIFLVIVLLVILTGCNNQTSFSYEESEELRIISSGANVTEILVGLGLSENLILVDEYSLAVEGVNPNTPTMDFYNGINVEQILLLQPDMFFATEESYRGDAYRFKQLEDNGIQVISISTPTSIQDIYDTIFLIGEITSKEEESKIIVEDMQEQIAYVQNITESIEDKKTVYIEISPAPDLWSVGGNQYLSEMITIAGGENIFDDENGWINVNEEAVISANPDVIFTTVSYVDDPVNDIKNRENWSTITAVQNDDVYYINEEYVSRASQSVVNGILQMSKYLYPEEY